MLRLPTLLVVLSPFLLPAATPEAQLRTAVEAKTGVITLPAGVIEISREIVLPADAHDLDIRGAANSGWSSCLAWTARPVLIQGSPSPVSRPGALTGLNERWTGVAWSIV